MVKDTCEKMKERSYTTEKDIFKMTIKVKGYTTYLIFITTKHFSSIYYYYEEKNNVFCFLYICVFFFFIYHFFLQLKTLKRPLNADELSTSHFQQINKHMNKMQEL